MALVLALDPDLKQGRTLRRLTSELAGHEVVCATSYDEAFAAIKRRIPDLVLFPLFFSPGEEVALTSRLHRLSSAHRERQAVGANPLHTLTIPLLASAAVGPTATRPRWFYWFKPHAAEGCNPRVLTDAIRSYLERRGTTVPALASADSTGASLPPAFTIPAAPAAPAPAASTLSPSGVEWLSPGFMFSLDAQADRAPEAAFSNAVSAPPPDAPQQVAAWRADELSVRPTSSLQTAVPAESEPAAAPRGWAAEEPSEGRGKSVPAGHIPSTAPADVVFSSLHAAEDQAPIHSVGGARLESSPISTLRDPKPATVIPLSERAATSSARLAVPQKSTGARSRGVSRVRWLPSVAAALLLVAGVTLAKNVAGRVNWFTAAPKTGIAELQSVPAGSEVLVDGSQLGVTPLSAPLSAGTHKIEFRYRGATRVVALDITAGGHIVHSVDWKRKPTGRLHVTSDSGAAAVLVDGKKLGVTPLTLEDLSAGRHIVTLESRSGSVQRNVDIKANETATLEASIYLGWLALFSPIEVKISEGGRVLQPDEDSKVMLASGQHQLLFVNSALGYRDSRTVEVKPGEVTPISIVPPKTAATVTTTPSAEVWIDGALVGSTPLVDLPLDIGTREFVFKNATLGERRLMITATVTPLRIDIDLTKPGV